MFMLFDCADSSCSSLAAFQATQGQWMHTTAILSCGILVGGVLLAWPCEISACVCVGMWFKVNKLVRRGETVSDQQLSPVHLLYFY